MVARKKRRRGPAAGDGKDAAGDFTTLPWLYKPGQKVTVEKDGKKETWIAGDDVSSGHPKIETN